MNENPFRHNPIGINNPAAKAEISDAPKYTQEQLAIKVEVATSADWEAYRKVRLSALEHNAFELNPVELRRKLEAERRKTPEDWQKVLSSENEIIFLAWNGTEPIGVGRAVRESKGWWHLLQAYVEEEFQEGSGKKLWGIGRRMFDGRLDEIKKRGGTKATLLVVKDKTDLIRKYGRRGFKMVKRIPAMLKTGSYIDGRHYLMEKELGNI